MNRLRFLPVLALILALVLILCACGGGGETPEGPGEPDTQTTDPDNAPDNTPDDAGEPAALPQADSQGYAEEYTAEDGTVVLKCEYSLPMFPDAAPGSAGAAISDYYTKELQGLKENSQEYLSWALEEYANAGVSYPYSDTDSFRESLRDDIYISFVRTHDTYTGGPHPNQLQSSETFRISDGARVTCYELFSADEGLWRPVVVQTIRDQMAERGWDNYYEEYTIEALDAIFQPEQFYLTEEGIVWYFQNYDLAPYAAGIQEFTVPYGVLQEMLS